MFNAGGDCGVAFFFILSGFVLVQGSYNKQNSVPITCQHHPEYKAFIFNRLSKVYPLHLLCLSAVLLLKTTVSIQDFSNLLLLQSWIPLADWYFSGNAVSWCLSDFLFFYAIFPFLYMYYIKHKKRFELIFISIASIYISFIIPMIPSGFEDGIIYINPFTREDSKSKCKTLR